ncbi:MAG: decaprenyl-phosphate phosphoribosyltransferase, partial [Planctomycetota bacterium]|nr:decaprenyl-phosphate phosphoribosyltransferase [Planctomycetota bacterium]
VAGAYAVGRPISEWLVICTFFLALFLALCKRHAELELLGDDSSGHRRNLQEYSIGFLNQTTAILAACSVLTYAMYAMDAGTVKRLGPGLIYTVPFVVFGIFRYLLLVQTRGGGGSPSKVLLGGDAAFALNGILWFLTTCGILFLGD